MADRVGQQLGNYRLTRLLGRGGYADVYLGEHIHLDTQAAIKILRTQLASDNIEKFRSEARTLARLVHPRIVRLLDFGIEDNIPFLVMDYASNGSLRQRYPVGVPLPLGTVVSIVVQVAEALQFAHDKKLIHRDIKPENIFLGQSNEVVLGDFGIAVLSRTSQSQNIQDVKGTITYMAPEQLEGKPSRASDQYSLGIVVYEWLSGDVPFHGSYAEILSQHMLVPPPLLHQKVPMIFPVVEEVVLKALQKETRNRFSSVQEFSQALATAFEEAKQFANAPTSLSNPLRSTKPSTIQAMPLQDNIPVPEKTKEQWLEEGDTYYNVGQYKEAAAAYYRAIVLDPKDALTYNKRGLAYYALKDYQQAIVNYRHAIEIDPEFTEAYCNRGGAYYDLEEYQQAIADYDRAIEINPECVVAYNNRGGAYHDLKDYRRAIADYDHAIELNPNDAITYYNRGLVYYDLKDYRKAIVDYDRTIAFDPEFTFAYNNRGFAYYCLEEYEQAIVDYSRAIVLDPEEGLAYNNRGLAYYRLEEYEQAIVDYSRAIELDPKNALAYNNRGLAYFELEDYRQVIADCNCAIELDPLYTEPYVGLGFAYFHFKDYQRAVKNFDRALQLGVHITRFKPERDEAYRRLKKRW